MDFRTGQWVECDRGIGIYMNEKMPDGQKVPHVHLVDDSDGTTKTVVPASVVSHLRSARAAAIPAPRIEHLTAEELAAMGYH